AEPERLAQERGADQERVAPREALHAGLRVVRRIAWRVRGLVEERDHSAARPERLPEPFDRKLERLFEVDGVADGGRQPVDELEAFRLLARLLVETCVDDGHGGRAREA